MALRVRVEGISKTYSDRRGRSIEALSGIDLTVGEEEFLAVLGPSGCGKSTLLLIVAGLIPPSAGRVIFEGADGGGRPLTGLVFQEFALFPWRTVRRNIEFGLEVQGLDAASRAARARQYLRLVGLEGFEDKYPHELSGGMRQRVGIARALVNDPALLLMDEPFSALDSQTRAIMQLELMRLWDETRKSVLYVTHNIEEAAFLADRVVLLSRRPGRIAHTFPVELPRPRTEATLGDPRFRALVDGIWASVKGEAIEALVDG